MDHNLDRPQIPFQANVSRVLRAARKYHALSQQKVAKALGVSQSKLSKIESGQLEPTVSQWLRFCQLVEISSDDGKVGYIDRASVATLVSGREVGSFRIPQKYAFLRGSKIRISRPLLRYFSDRLGEGKLNAYLHHNELDPDFFAILDNQLNADFNLDVVRHLIQSGELTRDKIPELAAYFAIPDMHGILAEDYLASDSLYQLIWILKNNLEKYEINCSYEFEDSKKKFVDLAIVSEAHFDEFDYLDDTLGDFLCLYKGHVFTVLFREFGHIKACQVEILEKQKRKGEKTVYRFSV